MTMPNWGVLPLWQYHIWAFFPANFTTLPWYLGVYVLPYFIINPAYFSYLGILYYWPYLGMSLLAIVGHVTYLLVLVTAWCVDLYDGQTSV